MNNRYKIGVLFAFVFFASSVYAQKTLRLAVTNVKTNKNTDCDALNDSDFEWMWYIGGSQVGCRYFDGNNGPINSGENITLWGTNSYGSADCWPTGTLSVTVKNDEEDDIGWCDDGSSCTTNTTTTAYPASGQAAGNVAFATNAGGDCNAGCDAPYGGAANLNYQYTAVWVVGGAYTGGNLDANGFINNKTCATAYDFGSASGTFTRTNQARGCSNTIWYKFTSSNNSSITLTSSAGGTITSYTGSCAGLTNTGQGGTISCPSNTTYWFNVATGNNTDITLTATAISGNNLTGGAANNASCATAYDFGTTPGTVTNQFKACNDIWYKYTPSANMATITFASSAGGTINAYTSCGGSSVGSGSGSLTLTCPSTVAYWFKVNSGGANTDISVSSSALSGSNYVSGAINNSTCATATVLTTDGTGNLATSQESRCTSYTWYKYTLTSAKGSLTFDPSSSTDVQIYYSSDGNCTGCNVASGAASATLTDAPAGVYYVRVANNTNGMALNVSYSGTPTNNSILTPTDVTINPGTTYNGSFNNSSYSNQSGEPRTGQMYNTAWYSFTTPAAGLDQVTCSISQNGGNNSAVTLYQSSGTTAGCLFGNLTERAFDRWCAASGGSVSYNCLPGNTKFYVQYGTANNFDLCIGGENTGGYNISISASATPAGKDNVCSAHDFGTISNNYNSGDVYYSNKCMGVESGEQRLGNMSNTMWYKFTTPANGLESVNVEFAEAGEGANYAAVTLYEKSGSCSGTSGLTERAFDRWCGSDGGSITYTCLPGNTTFYIQGGTGYNFDLCTDLINGGRSVGRYRLKLTSSNYTVGADNVCNAVSMGTLNGTTASLSVSNQSNICAGTQANEPSGGQKTVWYTFTTGATVGRTLSVNMDAFGNGLNADVYLYRACGTVCSGSALNAGVLQEIGNWYDVNPLPGEYDAGGSVDGVILPNTTYYIRADGVPTVGQDGQFNLSVTFSGGAPISNDNYCGATSLSSAFNYNSAQLSASTNTDNASSEDVCSTNEPDNSSEKSVWYKFTTGATPPAIITINPTASGVCTGQAYVYSGAATGACTGNAFSNYNTATNFNGLSRIDYTDLGNDFYINCPAANTTYYIQVQVGGLCSSGAVSITVKSNGAPKPTNDLCANAISLGTLTAGATLGDAAGTNRWNNFCAGSAGDPNPGWSLDNNVRQAVWFKFNTGSVGRLIDIEGYNDPASLGDQIDLKLAIYKGPCGSLTYVDRDYDPGFFSESMTDIKCLDPNTDYYILVDGSGLNTQGFFGLTVKDRGPYPANDLICGATTVPNQTIYTYNSTTLSTESNVGGTNCFEPNPDWTFETGQDNDHGIWYYLGKVPGRTVVVDGNSGSNDIDLQYALYSSATPKGSCATPGSSPALTEVQKEYAGAGVVWDEDAYFNCLDTSKYYWLMVDGSAGATSLITSLEEGIFSIRFWNPEEGETTFCAAENIGTVPNGGSVTKLNLANKCGVSSGSLGTSGSFTLPSGFTLDHAVVYKFTTPNSGSIEVTASSNPYYPGQMGLLTGDEIDLQLAVFEKSGGGGLCSNSNFFPKGNNYDATDGFNENLIVNCLSPNTEYYLLVDGSGLNGSGYFDITISDYGKTTPNDFLCNAIDITATNSAPWTNCNSNTVVTTSNYNNYCGTTNNDIPSTLALRPTAWSEINGPVWYKFKAPKSGKLKIEAINSISDIVPPYDEPEISAQLAVFFLPGGYQGNCTNLSTEKERLKYVGSNHDALLHDEEYTIECLMPDSIYYLLVDGSSELLCPTCTRGEFYLKLSADPRDRPATNDALCDAIDLGTPVLSTTIVDTKVSPASGAASNPSPSTGYPSATGLHNGARNNANSCMRAENNFCAGTANEPGVSGGTFLTDFSPDATVWYSFTAPVTGEVIIDAYNDPDSRGDQIDLQLAVYESSDGTCSGTMVPIKAEYNIGFFDETMRVQCLNPGQKYWIMVDGSGLNTYGYFELQVQAVTATLSAPANDDICNATTVTYPASIGNTTTLNNQTNRCATIQTIYSEPTTFTKDADVWYKFTTPNTAAPHAVEVTVTSGLPWPFGDAMDPQIALYKMNPVTGPCASSFTLVEDDYSPLGLPFYESFEFHCLEANTTYYLMVDGSGLNEQGNFKLDVKRITPHPLPTNDNICSVTNLATGSLGTLGATTGNKVGNTTTNWHNFCSTVESGESALMTDGNYSLDQTVWFKFRTPSTANNIDVEIRALNDPNNVGDQIDLQMLLVQGTPGCSPTNFTSLTPIESVDPALTFNATMNVCLPPNTDFYIQVDGSGLNKQGYFTLEIENKGLTSAPANDNICNAKALTIGAGTYTGSGYLNDNNNCATLEANEKQFTAGSIQRSVWYKFVCPTSADVSIEVKGNSWVPFTTNYFLPDVTIWELNDGTFASPATTIAGCTAPSASQWNKLEYSDSKYIPNSLANGIYPTVELTPLCLKPGYTYYVQVDGVAGIGLDGYFDIRIKNNQATYTGPVNNEASGATTVPISSASCQYSNGTWQSAGGYSFGTNPTWSNPSLIGISNPSALPACTQNCGDVWYKFQMPAACGNNTKSFVKIEGDDEFNLDLDGYPELAIAAYNGGATTSTSNLTYMKCSIGGSGADPDFSLAANPGDWIYLQIWDLAGNEQSKTFKLCVSEQKSADDCADATNMTLDIPYCWSIESHTGETPNSSIPGSGLNTCFGSGTPQHSSYFKFTTDAATNFCDDYYIYMNTAALAKLLPTGANHACLAGAQSSVSLNLALWELKTTGTACTPGIANVVQEDCITWNDCGGGSFGSNVTGPHGNGGLVDDTIWYNLSSGYDLKPATTYYIVLDYNIDNVLYESRVVLDGTITVGRRCKGRVWEYTTAPVVSSSNYCTTRDGWRHYYDDKGTSATADDRYIFSMYPNGNNFEGTATISLNPTRYNYEAPTIDYAEYVMKRRWDFQVTSGTIVNPVKIRFYYQTAEKQDIINAATTFRNAYGGYIEDFEWFKSANGHVFNVVTDVNPKVISVGPNGYSETGCFSYWDASGVYIGPPGVSRCQSLSASDWEDDNNNQWCNGVHYVQYNGLTGFSGGTGGTGVSPWDISPLPVELTSFTGYNEGSKNVLNWTTASESNTLKFVVERSAQGISFDYIGEVPAAGNSNQPLFYTLDDNNPIDGNNYYRLKTIDKDGTFSYSQTILVKTTEQTVYEDAILSIFPNPTSHSIFIDYIAVNKGDVIIKVFDALGQSVALKKQETVKGKQLLWLDVSEFANGVYIIHIQDVLSGKVLQSRFIKE